MPELRRDPVINRWVIVATERSMRPVDFKIEKVEPKGGPCPFCEGNENMTPPEIFAYRAKNTKPNSSGWWVRVVPNKFPALRIEGELQSSGVGIYDKISGIGAHEVVIESPQHHLSLADLELNNIRDVIWMYKERLLDLMRDQRMKYPLVFRNHHVGAGATLDHPHSQIIVTPIIPKRVKEELTGSKEYYEYKDRCVFCDIIHQEIKDKIRVVYQNDYFVAFCPYASRFPYEICLIPKEHRAAFTLITPEEASSLASALKELLCRLKDLLSDPPYNYILHTTPFSLSPQLKDYHWHIEIIPRLVRIAGFEWGTGFYVNPTAPEVAAETLRNSKN